MLRGADGAGALTDRAHNGLPSTVKEAIDWMVFLDSGNAQPSDKSAFERWLGADPGHRQAWESLNHALSSPFNQVAQAEREAPGSAGAATRVLRSSGISLERRRLLRNGSALMLLLGLSSTLVLQRRMPLDSLFSDVSTGTGERKHITLSDGSQLTLNARTTVDIDFSTDLRRVRLKHGELSIQVAADPSRPLEVWTDQGSVRALGTRFSVRQTDQFSLVGVQQHSVQVRTLSGQHAVITDGHALRFSDTALFPLPDDSSRLDAWVNGLLEVEDESLGAVIEALRPYRYGLIRVSTAAARLRVFGVFPLDHSDRALQSLAQVLPISVSRFGPVTLIDVP